MKKYIIFFPILLLILLLSCGRAFPPEEEEPYVPTIIYRIQRFDETGPAIQVCPTIEYTDENGNSITLTDTVLPWEYEMEVEDGDPVSLYAVHTQDSIYSGTAAITGGTFFLDDGSALFVTDSLPETALVVNTANDYLYQISDIVSETRLKLNLDTYTGGPYEIYNRLNYTLGIYRIDQTGIESSLVNVPPHLYANMDVTMSTYAY